MLASEMIPEMFLPSLSSPEETLQKIVDLAASHGRIKFSPKRQVMRMKRKGYPLMYARLYDDDGELWVNFDFGGMSGNDPIDEFYFTLGGALSGELD